MSQPSLDKTALGNAVERFVATLDDVLGVFLDASDGFKANSDAVDRLQAERPVGIYDVEQLDRLPFFVGKGDPNDPSNVVFHQTTQGEFKRRNRSGGRNHVLLSQYLVVLIYGAWELEHRSQIAATLGLTDPDALTIPILGDLRALRNDIVHHGGILTERSAKALRVITGLDAGMMISVDVETAFELVRAIKGSVDNLLIEHAGVDPQHRIIWHLT